MSVSPWCINPLKLLRKLQKTEPLGELVRWEFNHGDTEITEKSEDEAFDAIFHVSHDSIIHLRALRVSVVYHPLKRRLYCRSIYLSVLRGMTRSRKSRRRRRLRADLATRLLRMAGSPATFSSRTSTDD